MNGTITLKSNGNILQLEDITQVRLEHPSVISLPIDPAQVLRFERAGKDLVLVLKDGTTFTIRDFYLVDDAGMRNDLVLVDADGVIWWAQYSRPDALFEIAEIEHGAAPVAWGFFGGAPLLAALGGAAAIAGGSKGNRAPILTADAATVTEAGVEPGGNTPLPGLASVSGNVLDNDRDVDGGTLEVTGVALGGTEGTPGTALAGTYGTLVLGPDGAWSYDLDDSLAATQALAAGQTETEVFTYTVSDGQGGTASSTLTITVTGSNDAPVVDAGTSGLTGALTEAGGVDNATPGVAEATGQLVATDVDTGSSLTWAPEGAGDTRFGSFTVDPDGSWRFVLDDSLPATQALKAGEDVVLTYPVRVTDEHGAFATTTVTITVTGADDTQVITGTATGAVTEAGGVANATPGSATAGGQLAISDPDAEAGTVGFQAPAPASLNGTYGTFTFAPATGIWTYQLDNARPATQALTAGEKVTDELLVTSLNGLTTLPIVVTVTGSNDVPVVTNGTGAVAEDQDVRVIDGAELLVTGGKLDIADPDAGQSAFVPATLTYTGGSHGGAAFGSLTVGNDGTWSYSVANDAPAMQALAAGEELTQSWTVGSADGTASSTITVTITGTNDAPVILASSDLTGAVTEIADGATGENSVLHAQTGWINFTDIDLKDTTHTVSVAPQGTGYLGDFTFSPVDNAEDRLSWRFEVSDAVLDSLPAGEVLTQDYLVTITDLHGDTATETVTITITGANDRPEPEDDASLIRGDQVAVMDVLANDLDDDEGETGQLQVTSVDGQAIEPGQTITLTGGRGTVSLDGRGELSFTPAPGVQGQVVLRYTVDDGSGTANASAMADWVINVIGVDIRDNASPDDPAAGDNVLAQIDDLTKVEINGRVPVDGTLTALVIEDANGGSVTVPPGSVVIGADGSFTVLADLSGLDDGTLTVRMTVGDSAGNSNTATDTILKDTVTVVEIDPLLVVNGQVPTITGTAEPGATLTVTIGSNDPVTVVVGDSGVWSVTPAEPLAPGNVTIGVAATDSYGNTDTDARDLSGLELADEEPGAEHIAVHEAGLAQGSDPTAETEVASSFFAVRANLPETSKIVIGGTIVSGALVGGTVITVAELLASGTTPIEVPTDYGTLSVNGYVPATGRISYSYTLTGAEGHATGAGNNVLRENIQIAVTEADGDTRVDTLVAAVVDDVPQTPPGTDELTVTENGPAGTRNAAGGLLAGAVLGADGGRVHQISYTGRDGDPAVSAPIAAGGSVTVQTQHGTLQVFDTGAWTYTPLPSVDHVKPTSDTQQSDDFSFTVIDGDGDVSAPVPQKVTVLDTMPAIGTPEPSTILEASLPLGSDPNPAGRSVSGSLNLTPGADSFDVSLTGDVTTPAPLTSGGLPVTYAWDAATRTLTGSVDDGGTILPVFTLALTNATAANAGYVFTLIRPIDHGGAGSMVLDFGVEITDADGDADSDRIVITVMDDAPVTELTRTINEDGSVSFNTSADSKPGNTVILQGGIPLVGTDNGAGGKVYQTTHGDVTVNSDGTITYRPAPHFSGTELFGVETTDGTTTTSTTVTMNVTPVADAPTFSADAARVGTLEDTAVALGLNAPVILDQAGSAGNNAVSERIGAITLTGLPEGAVVTVPGASPAITHTVDATGTLTIHLTDQPSVTGTTGDLAMTAAQFETLQVTPPQDSSVNFTVTATVSSFEVDAAGVPLPGIAGAQTSTPVLVMVQAVTDNAVLGYDTTISSTEGATEITYGEKLGRPLASVTLPEDDQFDLSNLLQASFGDVDGSEVRSFTIHNDGGQPIMVGGSEVAAGASLTIAAPGLSGSTDGLPPILIGGAANYSGDLTGIRITLNAQDHDSDGYLDGGTVVSGPTPGVAEAATTDNSVYLDLYVTPVAGDVEVTGVTTPEDTAVNFLAGVRLLDTSTGNATGGQELITSIGFTIPTGWVVTAPTGGAATFTIAGDGTAGAYSITFTGGTQAEREAALDGFTIRPPAHSSADVTLALSISASDTATVNGAENVSTTTVDRTLLVTVTPVAERVDTDSDGNAVDDVTMTPGHTYLTEGYEDEWFDLGAEGTFQLQAGWSNADADDSETTYARLTPELISGDGSASNAIGSKFQWLEGGVSKEEIYTGSPVDVPVTALATLKFMAAPNFSGEFKIKVEAYTVDKDPDTGEEVSAVSGEAFLTNLRILPVADDVTLTIGARAYGLEDAAIPLSIRPTSSDPSESFTVTIDRIPPGAVLIYDGVPQTVVADPGNPGFGRVVIEGFAADKLASITPPPHSNVDFPLLVSAVSVDTAVIAGETRTSTSAASQPLELNVAVRGVADEATVTSMAATYVEAMLDAGEKVLVSDLFSIAKTDADGSETLTTRITGLEAGFALVGGTLLNPLATGADRIWVMSDSQKATASITVPPNFSGTVTFQAIPVTTENDGNSLTGSGQDVSFTVTPSPEAEIAITTVMVEDTPTSLGLGIAHRGEGAALDIDETLHEVRIAVSQAETATYTLALDGGPLTGLPTVTDGGVDYYLLTPAQAAGLTVQAAAHLDGPLGTLQIEYRVTDPGDGSVTPVTSGWQSRDFALTATPVTDTPDLTLATISGTAAGLTVTGDTVTVDGGGQVTATLNLASPDNDGSEKLVRVVIEGVPSGVSVLGAEAVGSGIWLFVHDGAAAVPIDNAAGISLPVVFEIGPNAGNISAAPITITTQVQDRGEQADAETEVLSDTVTWHLTTTFPTGTGQEPAVIEAWSFVDPGAREDTGFPLSAMVNAQVAARSSYPNILTVTLTDLPPGTEVSGMARTMIDGVETWTASATTEMGDDAAAVQARLQGLLDSITITPPENRNDNNADDFSFDLRLTTAVQGGNTSETADILDPVIPVTPVTDPASIAIVLGATDADGELTESDGAVPLTITVSNPADGAAGSILDDGRLYLTLATPAGMETGTLSAGGNIYALESVTGVPGVPDGNYYVIDGVAPDTPLDLVYTPDAGLVAGDVTVKAWVRNIETGAASGLTSDGEQVLPIAISNDGVTASSPAVTGNEAAEASLASLVQLAGLTVALTDGDGSETIDSILLSNLPEGFLVFTGPDAAGATMASNAGGAGGLNSWVLAVDGAPLPAYVAILPPKNWSGTLPGGDGEGNGLTLIVTSGETALTELRIDSFPMGSVTINPVANGVTLDPTLTFGTEGKIIPLNLNASMADPGEAVAGVPDSSRETATLQITGLGQYAAFYTGDTLHTGTVTYDPGSDTYTLAGLSQADLDNLGFVQARAAITGTTLGITVWTVDGGDTSAPETGTLVLNLTAQLATTGSDSLIWTGQPINGQAGEDTIHIRHGESLTGATLAANLRDIEVLDLSIAGANAISGLTPDQVKQIIGTGGSLSILGTAEDTVLLADDWQDNGDGTYTGTQSGGATVTLAVGDGVTVTGAQPLIGGLMMSFGTEDEGFGLAALDNAQPHPPQGAPATDPLTEDDLFSESGSEEADDLAALLPEEEAAPAPDNGGASGGASGGESGGWDAVSPAELLSQSLEDELLHSH